MLALRLRNRYDAWINNIRHQNRVKEAKERQQYQLELAESLEQWLATDVGQYFTQRLEQDRIKVLNKLALANPHDFEVVQRLQNQVTVIDLVNKYISEIRHNARNRMSEILDTKS